MHICFVCREYPPSLRGGGIASYIKEVVHGLHAVGHQITVICASDNTCQESMYDDEGICVVRLRGGDFLIPEVEKPSLWKKFRPLYRFYSYRKRIVLAIRTLGDVDIIEVPEYGAEGYFLHQLNIPVVVRLHTPMLLDHYRFSLQSFSKNNWHYYWQGKKELQEMKKAAYLSSCSTSLKIWAEQYAGVMKDRARVIYNPIDMNAWKGFQRKEEYREVKEILFAGTICDWKGCGDLAEACRILHQEDASCQFRLSLVGKTGIFAEQLQAKYGDEPWFNLVGKVQREELMERYTTADVICFPSWWENMPMVCIEAMLCGGIVLGSSSGGMSEIIEDGKSGFLIEPRNPRCLADKIRQIFNLSEGEKANVSLSAKQRIKDAFSLDMIIKQQIAYYKEVVEDYKNK